MRVVAALRVLAGSTVRGEADRAQAVLLTLAGWTALEIRRDTPALRRSRLSWVRQNYVRAETLTRVNAALVAAQKGSPHGLLRIAR